MKNNEIESFINLYTKERPLYKAWGEYLIDYISSKLKEKYVTLDKIIKIPVTCRTKEIDSLVAKAFYRNKNYKDPYNDITDKVGIRFVVMLENQVDEIGKIIESSNELLSFSKDQDFNVFRETHPDVFTYQSIHYVVRNKNNITVDNNIIVKNTPCEIQIRTLCQHAYAEISHDLFYKKNNENNKALRLLARTAAFNEESDELFGGIYKMVESEESYYNNFMKFLKDKYNFTLESDKLNKTIYDDINILLTKYQINAKKIEEYINEQSFILELIKEKQDNILFKQPIVLVLYYLVENHRHELISIWNFPDEFLDPIEADLGISMD